MSLPPFLSASSVSQEEIKIDKMMLNHEIFFTFQTLITFHNGDVIMEWLILFEGSVGICRQGQTVCGGLIGSVLFFWAGEVNTCVFFKDEPLHCRQTNTDRQVKMIE